MTITIEQLGAGGDGAALADGERIFIPLAAPGDVMERAGDGWRRIADGPDRVPARCRHYETCGGCALQHLSDAFIADWKRDRVTNALAQRGVVAEQVAPTVTIPAHSRRRAGLSIQRTKKTLLMGFQARGSNTVVDIVECPVLRPEIMAAQPPLRALARIAAPRARAVKLWVTVTDSGLDIALEDAKDLDLDLRQQAAALCEEAGFARLTWNAEQIAQRRPPTLRMGAAMVAPPPGAFLQAAAEGEAALVKEVMDGIKGAEKIADLFCGAGTFTFPLAAQAAVFAFDGDAPLIAALEAAARHADGLKPIAARRRDLFRNPVLAEDLRGFDAVVFDPPRAGAAAQAAEIAKSAVRVAIGVSCDPATFARDARTLIDGGYALERVVAVDQFRWSPHVELVGRFARRPSL